MLPLYLIMFGATENDLVLEFSMFVGMHKNQNDWGLFYIFIPNVKPSKENDLVNNQTMTKKYQVYLRLSILPGTCYNIGNLQLNDDHLLWIKKNVLNKNSRVFHDNINCISQKRIAFDVCEGWNNSFFWYRCVLGVVE